MSTDIDLNSLPPKEKVKPIPASHQGKTFRDTSLAEEANRKNNLYAPCPCGSGVGFKFCCKNRSKDDRKAAKLQKFKLRNRR